MGRVVRVRRVRAQCGSHGFCLLANCVCKPIQVKRASAWLVARRVPPKQRSDHSDSTSYLYALLRAVSELNHNARILIMNIPLHKVTFLEISMDTRTAIEAAL